MGNGPAAGSSSGGKLRIEAWPLKTPLLDEVTLDFQVVMLERPNTLEGRVAYAVERLDCDTVRWFANMTPRLLDHMSRSPDQPISSLWQALKISDA